VKASGIEAIDIAGISRARMKDSSWDPDTFPGLRLDKGDLLIRIFDTNRIVCMGANRPSQIRAQLEFIQELCEKYQRGSIPPSNQRFKFRLEEQQASLKDAPVATNLLSQSARHELMTEAHQQLEKQKK